MEIENIKLKDIIEYKNNAKLHPDEQVEQIKKSIKEFGFADCIAIDENNVIIEGNGRFKALNELQKENYQLRDGNGHTISYDEIPCVRLSNYTEEQKKAYILAHNKLTMNSDFDIDILNDELDSILNIDMSDFGFDLDLEDEEEQEIIEDEVPEVPEEPKAKLGDIYQLGNHRLMCGDSTSIDDVEKLINNKKLDLGLTDPPYGIDVVGDNGEVGADFGVAKKGNYKKVIADDTTETAQQSYDILSVYTERQIIWGGNYFTNFLPFSDGWIIWDKRVDSGIRNTFADGEMAWCSFHTPIRIYHQLWNGMIREGEKEKRVHPTQKPIRMLSDILKDFSKENDDILDLFGGSGSTLIACEQLNRNCYMMELDPHYISVIIERYINFTGNDVYRLNPDGTKTNWRDIECEKEK